MTCCSPIACGCSRWLTSWAARPGLPDDGAPLNYYRWKRQVDRCNLEPLNVRDHRRPRMPNEIGLHLAQRVFAFSLSQPGLGPVGSQSGSRARSGVGCGSLSTVWRVLCMVGLTVQTRPTGLKDIRWATSKDGRFYLIRRGTQKPLAKSSLYKVTGPFVKGAAYAPTSDFELVRVSLSNGKLTPVGRGLGTSASLVYVNPDGTVTRCR